MELCHIKIGQRRGKCYIIINSNNEYVYLVDGKIELDYPKEEFEACKQVKYLIKILPKQ